MMSATFLDTPQLAAMIGKSVKTCARWRHNGIGPKYVRVGPRSVLYRRSDVETWLNSSENA